MESSAVKLDSACEHVSLVTCSLFAYSVSEDYKGKEYDVQDRDDFWCLCTLQPNEVECIRLS